MTDRPLDDWNTEILRLTSKKINQEIFAPWMSVYIQCKATPQMAAGQTRPKARVIFEAWVPFW